MPIIQGRWGDNADHLDMKKMLGVKRLPVEGMPERLIQGVRVYVKPYVKRRWNSSGHRVIAICACGVHVSVGRLHQHKCKGGKGED